MFLLGETQILFRNLPKVSNFQKTPRSSYWGPKVMPVIKIWDHNHILEPRNHIWCLRIMDWEKLLLKSIFSKTVGTIVISVQRSSGLPNFIPIDSIMLVFLVSWRSSFSKIRNHWVDLNLKYIFGNQNIYYVDLKQFMVSVFQKSRSSRDEKH